MLTLFPDSARIDNAELVLGGVGVGDLVEQFGTPLVVYCEETLRARARSLFEGARAATVIYGSKAFPNVAVLRLLASEGVGVDVSTPGELAFARAAGVTGLRLVVHGNNKPDELLREAAKEGAIVVLDAEDEVERATRATVRYVMVRATLGVEANTHEAIRTGHHGSKFGLPPERVKQVVRDGIQHGLDVLGLHAHIGSQITDSAAHRQVIELLAVLAAEMRDELGWVPRILDVGGGFAVRHALHEPVVDLRALAMEIDNAVQWGWDEVGLRRPALYLEPGRALVGQAGVTLYRVGSVKRLDGITWVAVDGGMSDNPRHALYDATYTALSALRADERPDETVSVAGLHCESGDVIIDDVFLPSPRRGDLLAVPATGAYTLSMASNYNATPRPAAVLVHEGEARPIRRRETIEDLLRLEIGS
jgi:diaminopimelate decarboxylase